MLQTFFQFNFLFSQFYNSATLGWTVFAFDLSIEGKKKAIQLAHRHRVDVNYEVGEFQSLMYQTNQFDAIALIYSHFPADKKSGYHKVLTTYLRPGGTVILRHLVKNIWTMSAKMKR